MVYSFSYFVVVVVVVFLLLLFVCAKSMISCLFSLFLSGFITDKKRFVSHAVF